jgi:hypothetical protein
VAYDSRQARQEMLDDLAVATDALGRALAALGEAYEQLDEQTADRLEEELFRTVQLAYGRLKRLHAEFARRHGAPAREFESAAAGLASQGARAFIDRAMAAAGASGQLIAELQDSMLPIEVGDPTLRAELAEVRNLLDGLPGRARELVRTLGR